MKARSLGKLFACTALMAFVGLTTANAKTVVVNSPSKNIKVSLSDKPLKMEVTRDGVALYTMQDISMKVDGKELGGNTAIGSVKQRKVNETITPLVSLKYSSVESKYTEAVMKIGACTMELRVMDNAVAYRFATNMKGQIEVNEENFTLVPAEGYVAHRQPCGSFNTSFEEEYRHQTMEEWKKDDRRLSSIPLLLSGPNDSQLLLGEADVDDYPKAFLQPNEKGIASIMPKSPVKWEPRGDRSETITEEGNFISKTEGKRTFPWRYVVCTDTKGIIEQTLTLQLSRKSKIEDTSWIEPGQMSWEWWNGAVPYGTDVDFRAGNNFETYAYFADFAAKYGVKYILLDEGWAKSTRNPFEGKDELRLQELIKYAGSKGVGVILWLPWLAVEQNFNLFETYEKWGVKGVKIDFMDHADQWMVNYYKRVVEEAAKHHLIVDFHGAFTPAGLEYEYPNLVSYEGIRGLEYMRGCQPENYTYHPFIRNAVGPADFTPGAMFNFQPHCYNGERPSPGSMSTRCNQLALFVVLESGVQMLSDSPTRYYQNDDCTRYIASVPTTWDETRCLAAEVGKYVVVAKRKGNKWFIGGIANGEGRDLTVSLDFLSDGQHKLNGFKDGINADYQAMHYNKVNETVNKSTKLNIKMVRNGGYAAVIE